MKWVLTTLAGVLLIGNFFWASLFFTWRGEARRLEAEHGHLERRAQYAEQSKEQLTKDVQAAVDVQTIAGLYRRRQSGYSYYFELDLRSDGTAKMNGRLTGERGFPIGWSKISDSRIKVVNHGWFTIENGGLIDEQGNRWFRVR